MADKTEDEQAAIVVDDPPTASLIVRGKRSRRHRCLVFAVFTLLLVVFFTFGFIVLLHLEQDIIFVECFTSDRETRGLDSAPLRRMIRTTTGNNITDDEFNDIYDKFAIHFDASHSHRMLERRPVTDICREWLTFSVLTLTTIGYGRSMIRTEGGKIFHGVYCCFAIPLSLYYLFIVARGIRRIIECCVALCHCQLRRKGTVYYMEIHVFILALGLLCGYVALGVIDARRENDPVSVVDALYFYFVTFTTIGYTNVFVPRADDRYFGLVAVGGLILVLAFADATWKLLRKLKDQFCLCKLSCCCGCCCCCRTSRTEDLNDKGSTESLVDPNSTGNGMHLQRFRYDSATPYVTS